MVVGSKRLRSTQIPSLSPMYVMQNVCARHPFWTCELAGSAAEYTALAFLAITQSGPALFTILRVARYVAIEECATRSWPRFRRPLQYTQKIGLERIQTK